MTKAPILYTSPGVHVSQVPANEILGRRSHLAAKVGAAGPQCKRSGTQATCETRPVKKAACSILFSQLREQGKFRPHGGAPSVWLTRQYP